MTLSFRGWTVPLSQGHLTLRQAARTLEPLGVPQHDVPFLIQRVENPRDDLPGIEEDLLRACYGVEKRRNPQARESQRLFD